MPKPMSAFHRRTAVFAVLTLIVAGLGRPAATWFRQYQFIHSMCLVHFSTSLIGMPDAESERAAFETADRLQINLIDSYKESFDESARVQLAWLLISRESDEYCACAKSDIEHVSWPEVRIWSVRFRDEKLSPAYREKLFDLLLASPTSEAKLAVARWHSRHGRSAEAAEAYFAALAGGEYWDALDAADALLDSERYSAAAVSHLIAAVRESEPFISRPANTLLRRFGVEEESRAMLKRCQSERGAGPNRKALVERLVKFSERVSVE